MIKSAIEDFGNLSSTKPNLQKSNMLIFGLFEDVKLDLSRCMGMEVKDLQLSTVVSL